MCFPCICCRYVSIGSENCVVREGSGKGRQPPPRNIEISTKSTPPADTPRNFASITQLISYRRSDDVLHSLLPLDLLHLTSCSLVDYVENLARDLHHPIMPPPNKEEMHKTHATFLQSPTYYHPEETMIKYCGYWASVVRFYSHICKFYPSNKK